MPTPIELSDRIVAAYNAKDFAALRKLMHPDLDFAHLNRGFAYSRSDDLLQVLEVFAGQLMPDRRMGEPERVLAQGDTAVRVARWSGVAKADIPGFATAGQKVDVALCSLMRFRDGLLVEWKDFG